MRAIKQIIKKLPFAPGVKILNYDGETTLFALSKPEGAKSHPNRPGIDKKSILHAPYDMVQECYLCDIPNIGLVKVHLLNRLDSPTSGVLLLCLDAELVPEIRELFARHKINKTYAAIVKGKTRIRYGVWRDRLTAQKLGEKVRTEKGGERFAQTQFRLVCENDFLDISLLDLTPVTGLTHQLRVQGSMHRHPILGDKTYGDFNFNKEIQKVTCFKRLFLHSTKISFAYDYKGKSYVFTAGCDVPGEFNEVMEFNPRSVDSVLRR